MENLQDACPRCGLEHQLVKCPDVKAVEFDPHNGQIVRVEFLTPIDRRAEGAGDGPEGDYPTLEPMRGAQNTDRGRS